MSFLNVCGCCCQYIPFFVDDFNQPEGERNNYYYSCINGVRYIEIPPAGAMPTDYAMTLANTTGECSAYQVVNVGRSENLFLSTLIRLGDYLPDHTTMLAGVFIGKVARVVWKNYGGEGTSSHYFRVWLQWGIDEFGLNPTNEIDLGFWTPNAPLQLTLSNSWEDNGHVFVFCSGAFVTTGTGSGTYAIELYDVPLVPTINVGIVGNNFYCYHFEITRNYNSNRCGKCGSTDVPKLVHAYSLSVPTLGDDRCACSGLSGNYVLRYRIHANIGGGTYRAGCAWLTEDDDKWFCGDDAEGTSGNVPAVKWFMAGAGGVGDAWVLQASMSRNILKYICYNDDFIEGAANTFYYYDEGAGEFGVCGSYPASLTLIPIPD